MIYCMIFNQVIKIIKENNKSGLKTVKHNLQ